MLNQRNSVRLLILGLVLFILGLVLFIWKDYTVDTAKKINSEKIGQLGDFIGGVIGSIWSLAGVILFYVALTEQRIDIQTNQQTLNTQVEALNQQIKEFELQREELAETRKVLKEQSITQKYQRFENTFFQLLRTHNDIVESFDLRKKSSSIDVIATGRDCFEIFYKRLNGKIHKEYDKPIKNTLERYVEFFQGEQSDLGHYFRLLYHIIKFVHNSDITDKNTYTTFVRAQLSSYEQIILFYNCLSFYGNEKFKPLIEEYSLLKNMDSQLLYDQEHLKEYSQKAYGE